MTLNRVPEDLSSASDAELRELDDVPQITPVKPRRSPNRVLSQGRRTPSLQDKPIPVLTAPDSGNRTSPAPTKAERNVSNSLQMSPTRRTSLASIANRSISHNDISFDEPIYKPDLAESASKPCPESPRKSS